MIVAVVVLAIVIAALVANAIIDRVALRNRADAYVTSRDQLALKTIECDRASYERDAFKGQLDDRDHRIAALEAYVAEIEESPNDDLAPSDVAARIRRVLLHAKAEAADGARDPVRPDGADSVRDDQPAEAVRAAGPDDLLRPE